MPNRTARRFLWRATLGRLRTLAPTATKVARLRGGSAQRTRALAQAPGQIPRRIAPLTAPPIDAQSAPTQTIRPMPATGFRQPGMTGCIPDYGTLGPTHDQHLALGTPLAPDLVL